MGLRFRICLIVPPGYRHSHAFTEVALLLRHSLLDNGHACDIACNTPDNAAVNILLGYHLLTFDPDLARLRYIPFQLEQLNGQQGLFTDNLASILRHATAVWDYSPDNIAFLGTQGIVAQHLPVGYHPALSRIRHAAVRDIDALFYGSMGARRKAVLDQLAAIPGFKLQTLFGAYGDARDSHIARSRIILNIHHYPSRIFETVRIAYLLNNGCFVLSEDSDIYPYPGVDITCVPYDQLAATCTRLLADPLALELQARRCAEQFRRRYPMTSLIAGVGNTL